MQVASCVNVDLAFAEYCGRVFTPNGYSPFATWTRPALLPTSYNVQQSLFRIILLILIFVEDIPVPLWKTFITDGPAGDATHCLHLAFLCI